MRHHKRRSRQRGAIYVEGLIVLMFMTIFFAAQQWLYSMYKAEMEGFNQTQGEAFRNATAGCGAPLGASYDIGKLLGANAPSPYSGNPDPSYLGSTTNQIVISIGYSGAKPSILGGGTWSRNVSTQIMCAEPPMTPGQIFTSLGAIPWSIDGVAAAAGF